MNYIYADLYFCYLSFVHCLVLLFQKLFQPPGEDKTLHWVNVFKLHFLVSYSLRPQKKETLFTGWRTCQVGSVGRAVFFLLFFCLWFQKMTPKTRKFWENFDIFCRKILGKYLDLFSRNFSQNFQILVKKRLILQDLAKNKNNNNFLPKRKFGSVAPVKQGVLFSWRKHKILSLFEQKFENWEFWSKVPFIIVQCFMHKASEMSVCAEGNAHSWLANEQFLWIN